MHPLRAAPLPVLLSLAACHAPADTKPDAVYPDPKMEAALFEPIMTDPDLSQLSRRNIAVEPGGPVDHSLPGPFPSESPPR
jgi:hypothetical protein